jgi:CheY-like chemotaxis protein
VPARPYAACAHAASRRAGVIAREVVTADADAAVRQTYGSRDQWAAEAPVGVLVVDDQAVFRATARAVIEATPSFAPVGDAPSGEHALALLEEIQPQLVLLDIRMPGMNGPETARRIAAAHPDVVVVLVSACDPRDLPDDPRACGAAAAIRKQDLGPRLLRRLWSLHGPSR